MTTLVVNIQTYGNFNQPKTRLIMIAPVGMPKDKIGLIIREVERDLANSDDEQAAADILKQHGFRIASFTSLTIGGSLY